MARLVSLSIPIREAREIGARGDRALMADDRQIIKNTLATAFGEAGVRPWRLVGDDGEFYHVAGWLSDRIDAEALARKASRVGAMADVREFRPRDGQLVLLDVHASPQRSRISRDADGDRTRHHSYDAAEDTAYANAREAYQDWMEERLLAPRTGLALEGEIQIRSTRPTQGVFRHGKRYVTQRVPQVEARVLAKVMDANQFEQYLHLGLGPMKFAGYGSVFAEARPDA